MIIFYIVIFRFLNFLFFLNVFSYLFFCILILILLSGKNKVYFVFLFVIFPCDLLNNLILPSLPPSPFFLPSSFHHPSLLPSFHHPSSLPPASSTHPNPSSSTVASTTVPKLLPRFDPTNQAGKHVFLTRPALCLESPGKKRFFSGRPNSIDQMPRKLLMPEAQGNIRSVSLF